MLRQHLRVLIPERAQEPSRPFDVGEEERDAARRKIRMPPGSESREPVTAWLCLRSRCGRSLEQRIRLGERRPVSHRREQLARLAQRLLRLGLAERGQAAALAEQGVGALGDVPELAPALGRLGVEGCGLGVVAGGFGELGAGRRQSACSASGVRGSTPSTSRAASSGWRRASAVRTSAGKAAA